ncbi:MAG: formate dehydrogenase accessory sulfurtransferase FdhD [Myxococcaceae bacterium]|nr:formate dehydrogenase accessory sulfurtransferase FdhD [Myxococcaceae bacterium]
MRPSSFRRQLTSRPVLRVTAGECGPHGEDSVAVEEPLEIRVAGEPVAITMRTPGDDARLAVGFLFSEGIVRSIDDVGTVAPCGRPGDEGYGNVVDVTPAPGVVLDVERVETSRRGTLTTAACGVCGRRAVDDLLARCGRVTEATRVPASLVAEAPVILRRTQALFSRTGGVHGAAALGAGGEVLAAFEDVGRHNAVDKVVGELLHTRRIGTHTLERPSPGGPRPAVLVVSGRASFEMVQKAAMAGIPVVASVSAASSLAVDLAERTGIALATFVRDGRFNLHTHPMRVDAGA